MQNSVVSTPLEVFEIALNESVGGPKPRANVK